MPANLSVLYIPLFSDRFTLVGGSILFSSGLTTFFKWLKIMLDTIVIFPKVRLVFVTVCFLFRAVVKECYEILSTQCLQDSLSQIILTASPLYCFHLQAFWKLSDDFNFDSDKENSEKENGQVFGSLCHFLMRTLEY